MNASTNKHPVSCHNSLSFLFQLCQDKDQKTSHIKILHEQLDTVSRATCCPWATGWASPV